MPCVDGTDRPYLSLDAAADAHVVDRDAGVLAQQVVGGLGHRDVAHHRAQHRLCGGARLVPLTDAPGHACRLHAGQLSGDAPEGPREVGARRERHDRLEEWRQRRKDAKAAPAATAKA